MLHSLGTTTAEQSFLGSYRPPGLDLADGPHLPAVLRPVWEALRGDKVRLGLRRGYKILREEPISSDLRAALLAGLAWAQWKSGVHVMAKQMAYESFALHSHQWLAHRVLLSVHFSERAYKDALQLIGTIESPEQPAAWDEPLSELDCRLICASCSWMTGNWETTAGHLAEAFPSGVASMPSMLQEDWFRLAFYRERPDDAATAARHLIANHSIEKADILLQALVRQGWHKEALALYRAMYDVQPTSELLRRRVVGLYIRDGQVQEARRLMEGGALRLTG